MCFFSSQWLQRLHNLQPEWPGIQLLIEGLHSPLSAIISITESRVTLILNVPRAAVTWSWRTEKKKKNQKKPKKNFKYRLWHIMTRRAQLSIGEGQAQPSWSFLGSTGCALSLAMTHRDMCEPFCLRAAKQQFPEESYKLPSHRILSTQCGKLAIGCH